MSYAIITSIKSYHLLQTLLLLRVHSERMVSLILSLLIFSSRFVLCVEEQDEIPGHSVGGLDVKIEVGRNLGLRKSKQDYKKEGRRERKFKRKFFFPYASV